LNSCFLRIFLVFVSFVSLFWFLGLRVITIPSVFCFVQFLRRRSPHTPSVRSLLSVTPSHSDSTPFLLHLFCSSCQHTPYPTLPTQLGQSSVLWVILFFALIRPDIFLACPRVRLFSVFTVYILTTRLNIGRPVVNCSLVVH
jgi:hypothetical protein